MKGTDQWKELEEEEEEQEVIEESEEESEGFTETESDWHSSLIVMAQSMLPILLLLHERIPQLRFHK